MRTSKFIAPFALLFMFVLIWVVNASAEMNHWYWQVRWLDKPMHFWGGAWLASFGLWLFSFRNGIVRRDFLPILSTALLFAFDGGLFWELYEAITGLLTVGHMNIIFDTLGDLLFDILGGTTVAVLVWFRVKFK